MVSCMVPLLGVVFSMGFIIGGSPAASFPGRALPFCFSFKGLKETAGEDFVQPRPVSPLQGERGSRPKGTFLRRKYPWEFRKNWGVAVASCRRRGRDFCGCLCNRRKSLSRAAFQKNGTLRREAASAAAPLTYSLVKLQQTSVCASCLSYVQPCSGRTFGGCRNVPGP